MRNVKIFSGRSHPALTKAVCDRLGTAPGICDLGNFANGETSVQIGTSVRNGDVFIIQSGSPSINDSVMELLIMIAACKGGSAKSITAVIPYFPYSRQSKKKSHRGSITAKMLANLMVVAGVDHVITVDLHATQMQGFFGKPVDNLFAEPLIARWIKSNIPRWKDAVVVSKNVGGTKRVTQLADTLKVSFAIVSTDRTRQPHPEHDIADSTVFFDTLEPHALHAEAVVDEEPEEAECEADGLPREDPPAPKNKSAINGVAHRSRPKSVTIASSPLVHTSRLDSTSPPDSANGLTRVETAPSARRASEYEAVEGYTDERAREVITSRLIHGHVVDDDYPSPALSGMSASISALVGERQVHEAMDHPAYDPMTSSFVSTTSSFQPDHALGGTFDAAASSEDEEENIRKPEIEHTITLVGNVRDRTVFLVDDILDKSGSWIAAAETCVKKGGARSVYCMATHALLGEESLQELEECDCIDKIVVTNTFPITLKMVRESQKLVIIDVSQLLAESIRRNHHGESISALFHGD